MAQIPDSVADFLSGRRLVVAGVSRDSRQPANAIFRRLRDSGHEVIPVNPNARHVEGVTCYETLSAVPGPVYGVVIATHPKVSAAIVQQCGERGIPRVWFHRSFGQGSVSDEALRLCRELGLSYIVGGCPMMYCDPVDIAHRCMKWWLHLQRRIPQ